MADKLQSKNNTPNTGTKLAIINEAIAHGNDENIGVLLVTGGFSVIVYQCSAGVCEGAKNAVSACWLVLYGAVWTSVACQAKGMCTVTVIRSELDHMNAGVWLVSSRDELHERMPSHPPRVHHLDKRQAIFPVDPEGGGTWVGVNDLGTAVSLLNHYPEYVPEPTMKQSRGDLVVRLLAADSEALTSLADEDLTAYGSCKLVTVNAVGTLRTLTWDGRNVKLEQHDLPQVWASSSTHHTAANDHRCRLFHSQKPTTFARLCAFHGDQSHLDGALNVLMHSPEARTVSVTAVHIAPERVTLHHLPLTATQPSSAKWQLEQAAFQPYQLKLLLKGEAG